LSRPGWLVLDPQTVPNNLEEEKLAASQNTRTLEVSNRAQCRKLLPCHFLLATQLAPASKGQGAAEGSNGGSWMGSHSRPLCP